MATNRQKKAAEKLVENGGKSVSAAMRDAGYSPETAKNPSKLTESKGFQQLMDDMGLTDEFILDALIEDIRKKPQNRKPELELAAKMRGRLVERVKQESDSPIRLIVEGYGLNEGWDARETDQSLSDASEGQTQT